MKELIKDYKRKLEQIKRVTPMDDDQQKRLEVKASCYRTFITELERIVKEEEK